MRPTEDRREDDRRQDDLTPIREQRSGDDRRGAEPFVPVWKRRAAAKLAEVGYVAVADLTGKAA